MPLTKCSTWRCDASRTWPKPSSPPGNRHRIRALGRYVPHGVGDAEWIAISAVGEPYPLSDRHRIIAADGTGFIRRSRAVETPETAWALLCQVRS